MPERHGISIGPDQWIAWVDLDFDEKAPLRLDSLLAPTLPFWEQLETLCVAECCGIDAFLLWPEDVKSAAAAFGTEELRGQLLLVREQVLRTESRLLISSRLNNLFAPAVFVQLIDHLLACL